jgi:hypothetical protein
MKTRLNNSFFQYALIVSLGTVLLLGQTFKLHMHVKLQAGDPAGAAEQIGQLHIASTLHDDLRHSDSRLQTQSHDNSAEIEISSDSYIKKAELLVLAGTLFLVCAVLLLNLRPGRVAKRFSVPTRRVSSLLYFVNPPLRAPPAVIHS